MKRKNIAAMHRLHWADRRYGISVIFGLALLAVSIYSGYLANSYLKSAANNPVPDLLLDFLPYFDVADFLLVGMITFFVYLAYLFITRPKIIPFTLKVLSISILIRSIFIILTHLGAPTTYYQLRNPVTDSFFPLMLDDGFFFSGHAAIPFILALAFWKDRSTHVLFLLISIAAAFLVLIGRLHYSIDVFAAYFIGWGIFSITKMLFRGDYRRVLAAEN